MPTKAMLSGPRGSTQSHQNAEPDLDPRTLSPDASP